MTEKADVAQKILYKLGIPSQSESGKQIRETLAMEILADEFAMQDKYSKAVFVKTQGAEIMKEVRQMLEDEGILTKRRKIEHK